MTKYSYNEHSQSDDGPYIDFDIDDILEDMTIFRDWINDYNNKLK